MLDNKQGENLAKVLLYYGLIESPDVSDQKIVCPFHEDVNPSMAINLVDGTYYCFGCNKSGGPESFVFQMESKYNGLNDLQSLIKYHKILKTNKSLHLKFSRSRKYKKSDKIYLVMAQDYYYCLSKTDWYSNDSEVLKVLSYMKQRGFTREILSKVGAKITYNNSYPIIFPIMDNKEFRGYVCRTTNKSIEQKRKYLYNEGFSRATTLVGKYSEGCIPIIVEGYMDMLKLIQFGEENVIALFGWKATENQINKMKKAGIKKIICATDNDDCGVKGYHYLKNFFDVKRFCFPKGVKDVGEMNVQTYKRCKIKTMSK